MFSGSQIPSNLIVITAFQDKNRPHKARPSARHPASSNSLIWKWMAYCPATGELCRIHGWRIGCGSQMVQFSAFFFNTITMNTPGVFSEMAVLVASSKNSPHSPASASKTAVQGQGVRSGTLQVVLDPVALTYVLRIGFPEAPPVSRAGPKSIVSHRKILPHWADSGSP